VAGLKSNSIDLAEVVSSNNPAISLHSLGQILLEHDQEQYQDHPLPAKPTACRPGSEAKIRCMIRRVRNREQCFHPGDLRLDAFDRLGSIVTRNRHSHVHLGMLTMLGAAHVTDS